MSASESNCVTMYELAHETVCVTVLVHVRVYCMCAVSVCVCECLTVLSLFREPEEAPASSQWRKALCLYALSESFR